MTLLMYLYCGSGFVKTWNSFRTPNYMIMLEKAFVVRLPTYSEKSCNFFSLSVLTLYIEHCFLVNFTYD